MELYGLPQTYPGKSSLSDLGTAHARAQRVEQDLSAEIDDWRFFPYVQVHESEALVLACLDELGEAFDAREDLDGIAAIRRDVQGTPPEMINDGRHTAPSKRLQKFVPGYDKVVHGPFALELAGLAKVREACPLFDAWLSYHESLGDSSQGDLTPG